MFRTRLVSKEDWTPYLLQDNQKEELEGIALLQRVVRLEMTSDTSCSPHRRNMDWTEDWTEDWTVTKSAMNDVYAILLHTVVTHQVHSDRKQRTQRPTTEQLAKDSLPLSP